MMSALLVGLLVQIPEIQAVYIGHSLMSDIPDMVQSLSPNRFTFKEQFVPGAPLRWQWDEPQRKGEHEPQFRGVYSELITSSTKVVVLIDSVPRGEPKSLNESVEYAGRFLKYARERNPKMKVYFYEPWHHITSGTPHRSEYDRSSPSKDLTWRPRIREDRKKWDEVVARVNKAHPGIEQMKLIPAGTGLGVLADEIEQGNVTGLKSIHDVFDDDIHLNPIGKFYVAMIHHHSLFGEIPAQLPTVIKGRWGTPYFGVPNWQGKTWPEPSQQTLKELRAIAKSAQ